MQTLLMEYIAGSSYFRRLEALIGPVGFAEAELESGAFDSSEPDRKIAKPSGSLG